MQLYIGNKNYSSWSMRPWVLMRQFELPFQEVMLRFDSFRPESVFKQRVLAVSPAGRVPVLVADDGLIVWDSLAIAETLAERFPGHAIWPRDAAQRARARSLCAEMHAGFSALRTHCPMNIEARLPDVGARVLAQEPGVAADLDRIVRMWTGALESSGGPFLFGEFGNVDAYFAPVALRIRTYGLPVPGAITAYIDRLTQTTGVSRWIADALVERDFVPEDEPYRTPKV